MAKDPPSKSSGSSKSGPAKSGRSRKAPPVVVAKPKPWGLIAAALAVVLFAAAAIGYAVVQVNNKNELADPSNIQGLMSKTFAAAQHTSSPVDYSPDSPPFGGGHDPEWADCTGTVYPMAIRNENAVHALEHGAVWITYNPDLSDADVATLSDLVDGQAFMLMSPYPDLKTEVSLQAWGSQLFVDSVTDPRIKQFITALKVNPEKTPEVGASCDNPTFKATPRTPDETAPPTDTGPTDPAVTTVPNPATTAP